MDGLTHIAIVPDGNRRWAKKHGKNVMEGHWAGIQKLKDVASWCRDAGVEYLTLWILSTENASRTKSEVEGLFKLFERMLGEIENGHEDSSIRFAGDFSIFPQSLVKRAKKVEEKTKGRKLKLIILMGYGGRREIVDAVNKLIEEAKEGKISKVDEESFRQYLYAPDIPDPDLIFRSGGEKRLSGLLPWQTTYSEFYFSDKLWPEITRDEFDTAIADYRQRHRRFGK